MPLITWPTALGFESVTWGQNEPVIRQRGWSGAPREVYSGESHRWFADATMISLDTVAQQRLFLATLFAVKAPGAYTEIPIVYSPQRTDAATAQFTGTQAAGARSAVIQASVVSQIFLYAGSQVQVPLNSGMSQVVSLTADVTVNGSGLGTMQWEQPLRTGAPIAALGVLTPKVRMQLISKKQWTMTYPMILASPALSFEEYFGA